MRSLGDVAILVEDCLGTAWGGQTMTTEGLQR